MVDVKVLDLPDSGLTAGLVVTLRHGAVVEEQHGQQVRQPGGLLHGGPGAPLLSADNAGADLEL